MLKGLDYSQLPVRKDGEELFRWQCDILANYLLLKDKRPILETSTYQAGINDKLKWLGKGELVAGSYAASCICALLHISLLKADDIDIYFKSKKDAMEFNNINGLYNRDGWESDVCTVSKMDGIVFNLIYGVDYDSPQELISSFDIRAISIAIDPSNSEVHVVNGAIQDLADRTMVFNPTPKHTSIKRIVKYTQKEFTMEPHQRLFFAELIRSDIYSPEVELITGYSK